MVWRVSNVSDWAEWSQQVRCRNLCESCPSMLEMRFPDLISSFVCCWVVQNWTSSSDTCLFTSLWSIVVDRHDKDLFHAWDCVLAHLITKQHGYGYLDPPCPLKSTAEGNLSGHDSVSQSYVRKKMFFGEQFLQPGSAIFCSGVLTLLAMFISVDRLVRVEELAHWRTQSAKI